MNRFLKSATRVLSFRSLHWLGGLLLALAALTWWVNINPLPNDEELLSHFEAHRREIEELVRRYRESEGVDSSLWDRNPDTQGLLRNAGVDRVVEVGALWLPDPYAAETAQFIDRTIRSGSGCCFFRRYKSLVIDVQVARYYRKSLRYLTDYNIWKTLIFYPEIPRIENGWLIGPARTDGKNEKHYRVLPSLDSYPENWKRGECVVRKIEAHWFLKMCRAA